MKELFLSSFLTSDELHIIDQEHINRSISLPKNMSLVVAIPYRIDEFIHEAFQRQIRHVEVRIGILDRVAGCLNEVGLSQSNSAIQVKWIVGLSRRLSD